MSGNSEVALTKAPSTGTLQFVFLHIYIGTYKRSALLHYHDWIAGALISRLEYTVGNFHLKFNEETILTWKSLKCFLRIMNIEMNMTKEPFIEL